MEVLSLLWFGQPVQIWLYWLVAYEFLEPCETCFGQLLLGPCVSKHSILYQMKDSCLVCEKLCWRVFKHLDKCMEWLCRQRNVTIQWRQLAWVKANAISLACAWCPLISDTAGLIHLGRFDRLWLGSPQGKWGVLLEESPMYLRHYCEIWVKWVFWRLEAMFQL